MSAPLFVNKVINLHKRYLSQRFCKQAYLSFYPLFYHLFAHACTASELITGSFPHLVSLLLHLHHVICTVSCPIHSPSSRRCWRCLALRFFPDVLEPLSTSVFNLIFPPIIYKSSFHRSRQLISTLSPHFPPISARFASYRDLKTNRQHEPRVVRHSPPPLR